MPSKKTVLLSGAAGFIASHLSERLLAQGHQVIGVDNFNDYYSLDVKVGNLSKFFDQNALTKLAAKINSPYKSFSNPVNKLFSDPFDVKGEAAANFIESNNADYKFYGIDLCDYASLRKVFEKHSITHIVHLAGAAGVRPSVTNPIFYQKNNGDSTVNLLDLAAEFKISKFVFASSSSVYGESPNVPFSEEQNVIKPISPYAATKVAGEALLHTFHHLYKIPSVALRFFTVYGPRQRPDLAIHKFTKLIDQGKAIQIYGDGSAKRDFTYIDDIMDGVIKSIDFDCKYEVFNLGESKTTDVKTLVGLIEKSLGKKAVIEYQPPVPGDVPITYADISKAKTILGYNPQTLIETGIPRFVEWYREINYSTHS